jgi:hypothetical protein
LPLVLRLWLEPPLFFELAKAADAAPSIKLNASKLETMIFMQ